MKNAAFDKLKLMYVESAFYPVQRKTAHGAEATEPFAAQCCALPAEDAESKPTDLKWNIE